MRSVIVNEYQIDKVISFFLISPEANKACYVSKSAYAISRLKKGLICIY